MVSPIFVVSGLPRSGTSLMMQMLAAGGIPPLTDKARSADADNPHGYFEYERVKALRDGDSGWLEEAQGRAVKVISPTLRYLPVEHSYRMVFMERGLEEVLASQRAMLARRGEPLPSDSEEEALRDLFAVHLREMEHWLPEQAHILYLRVPYGELVQSPGVWVPRISSFCGGELDKAAMAMAVDPGLYRNKRR